MKNVTKLMKKIKKKKKCLCYVFSSLPVVVGDTTNAWTNTPCIIKGI